MLERAIPVRALSEIVTVDPNLAVAIDAVKFNEDQFSLCSCGGSKGLAIPGQPAWQCSAARAGRVFFTKFTFNAPIMREVQLSPMRIIQQHVLPVLDVAKLKAPILIERNSLSWSRISHGN